MDHTIIIIGSLAVVAMFVMLILVVVPEMKERIVKLASRAFRRSQDPILPVVQPACSQAAVPPVVESTRAQAPVPPVVKPTQAQPEMGEASGQHKGFTVRQVEASHHTWTQPTDVAAPPPVALTTVDLTRKKFKEKYLPRDPVKDALQDELHRKAREGFRPNPNGYRYF